MSIQESCLRWVPAALPVLVIVGLNLLAHFLPFERVSLTLDDLTNMSVRLQPGWSYGESIRSWLAQPGPRPLVFSTMLLDWLIGDVPALWITTVFLTSTLLAVSVYYLTVEMVGNRALGLICGGVFVLLPNKVQLYHHLLYSTMNAAYAVTVASAALFLIYLRNSNRVTLWVSLMCYTVVIFWYEAGFFLPLLLIVAAWFYERKKLGDSLLFLLPAGLSLLWRGHLLSQGYPSMGFSQPLMYFKHQLFVTVPNLYFGRQMIKWIAYGLARFPTMESPWVFILLAMDGLALWGFFRWLRRQSLPWVPLRAILLSAAMGVFFLAPFTFIPYMESRHTALASIGFSVLVVAAVRFFIRWRPLFPVFLFGMGLIMSQGIAWNQVVSCRMNNAIEETIKEKMGSILQADRVLYDQYSFAQRIPYTWVKDPANQLDYYWGVEGLLGKGFETQLSWMIGRTIPQRAGYPRKILWDGVHLARSPVQSEGEMLTFDFFPDFRAHSSGKGKIPRKGTVLIDYAAVYPDGFYHGKRKGP